MASTGDKRGRPKKEEDVSHGKHKVVKKKKTNQRSSSSKDNSKSDAKNKATRQASSSVRPFDFNLDDIKPHKEMLKIVSWNVNGIKSLLHKHSDSLKSYLEREMPDLLCLQETKISFEKRESMQEELEEFYRGVFGEKEASRYKYYWNCSSTKKGYSGTLLISKIEPINVDFGDVDSKEGRAVIAEFPNAFVVNTYVPNSGMKLDRLSYRTEEWDSKMREKLEALNKEKAVIWCGDLNVAHSDTDVANWKKKRNKCPGFCDKERENFGLLVGGDGNEITDLQRTKRTLPLGRPGAKEGKFVDVWKSLYPEEEGFTFWGYRMNSRGKNNGWRLDYFVISKDIVPKVVDCLRRNQLWGPSDHIPLVLLLKKDTLT